MADNQGWCSSGFSSWSIVFCLFVCLFFFFLVYINDLSNNLESNVKLFADDTSIVSVFRDPIITHKS